MSPTLQWWWVSGYSDVAFALHATTLEMAWVWDIAMHVCMPPAGLYFSLCLAWLAGCGGMQSAALPHLISAAWQRRERRAQHDPCLYQPGKDGGETGISLLSISSGGQEREEGRARHLRRPHPHRHCVRHLGGDGGIRGREERRKGPLLSAAAAGLGGEGWEGEGGRTGQPLPLWRRG